MFRADKVGGGREREKRSGQTRQDFEIEAEMLSWPQD